MSASDLRQAVRRLTGGGRGFEPLKPLVTKGARPGTIATGRPASAQSGVGSDLVENSYAEREYWPAVTVESTDGIFTLEIEPIKRVVLEGGGSFDFKQPT